MTTETRVVAVRDDGSYDGETIADLLNGGLEAIPHPTLEGWLLIATEGLHGSDPEDVDWELSLHSFESRVQQTGHPYRNDDPTVDECDVDGCGGIEARDHITLPATS